MFLVNAHLSGRSNVVLDDCKFHECVDLTEFEHDKVLHITPPDGEVSSNKLNYVIDLCSLWQ